MHHAQLFDAGEPISRVLLGKLDRLPLAQETLPTFHFCPQLHPQVLKLVMPTLRVGRIPGYRKWLGNQGAQGLGLRTLLPT